LLWRLKQKREGFAGDISTAVRVQIPPPGYRTQTWALLQKKDHSASAEKRIRGDFAGDAATGVLVQLI